jgi:hypothetical protein
MVTKTWPTPLQAEDIIYVLNEEYADLFPGLGSRLVSPAYISKIIWTDLSSMAEKGTCISIELNKKQHTVIYHIVHCCRKRCERTII